MHRVVLGRRKAAAAATLVAWTSTFLLIPALHALGHHDDDHIHLPGGGIVHLDGHHHHHHDIDEFIPAVEPTDHQKTPETLFSAARPDPVASLPLFIAHGSGGAAHFAAATLLARGDLSLDEHDRVACGRRDSADAQHPRARSSRSISARGPPALLS